MTTSHFARIVYHGRGDGRRAAARVAYIMRTRGGQEDLVYTRARNLPEWAGEDPSVFFTAAEQYESAAWTAYEEWRLALPRELSRKAQMDAAHDFLQSTFGDRQPYLWAFHDTRAVDGESQPHLHVLWSARTLDGIGRSPSQFFMRGNGAQPARGGAPKAREFGHFGAVKATRVQYTDVMNLHLERAGSAARLHPDRLEARGILRTPEPRLDPRDSRAFKERGEVTVAMQEVLDHRKRTAIARGREAHLALEYWEARKRELGLTREMESGRSVAQMRDARVQRVCEAPTAAAQEVPRPRSRGRERERVPEERLLVPLVGNVASKIFHAPGDPNYGDVHPQKQVLFWRVSEAEDAGYRAAVNQHYGRGAEARRAQGLEGPSSSASRGRGRTVMQRERQRSDEVCLVAHRGEIDGPQGQAVRLRVFDEERHRRGE